MRYRAAAVVLALAAAVAIGQVPMYSDYPWGLVNNGTDQGPVWNLDCKPPLWCSVPQYGNGRIQLGDGGALPIVVDYALFASDAGAALLAAFALDAGLANRSITADFALDAGFSLQSGLAVYALDAGLAGRSFTADFAQDAGFAIFAGDAGRAYLSNFSDYASDAGYSQSAGLAGVATYALDAGLASKAAVADFARDAGSAASADLATAALWAGDAGFANSATLALLATYALDAGLSSRAIAADFAADAGNLQCTTCVDSSDIAEQAVSYGKLDNGAPFQSWDEGRGGLLADRVTSVASGSKNTPESTDAFTTFTPTSGATDFYFVTDIQRRTGKDLFATVTYRCNGSNWKDTDIIRLFEVGSFQSTTATMYGDGNWHTAVFNISAFTGTSNIRVDFQDSGTAIGSGSTLDVSYVATGTVGSSGQIGVSGYRGSLGIGVAVPAQKLDVRGGTEVNAQVYADSASATRADLRLRVNNTTGDNYITFGDSASFDVGRIHYNHNSNYMATYTNGSERVRVDSDGMVSVNKPSGGKASIYSTGSDTVYQAITTTSSTSASFPQQQIVNYSANGGFPALAMYNSRGTAASPSGLNSGDYLGVWASYGRAASAFVLGTSIESILTAAPGLSTLTSALRFSTANNSTIAERMRIASNGNVGIGKTNPQRELSVVGQVSAAPSGTNEDVSYGGSFISTKASTASQHINIIRSGNRVWSIGFRPSSNTFLIAGGEGTDSNFGNNQPFALDTSGRVGIGTVAPGARLHTVSTNENLRMEGTDPWASYYQSGTRKGWWGYGDTAGTTSFSLVNEVSTGNLRFDTNGGNYRFIDFGGGGTTGASLDNDGDLIRTPSDGRLKEDVHELTRNLDAVLQMRPVRFHWKDKGSFGARWDIGFIAQEMISSVPEAVSKNPDDTYSLDYQKLIAVVVGAIQELFDDRTWLARRVQELEDRAQKAEDKLAQLEARLLSLENYSGIKGCGNCPQTDDLENPK